jgi:hypothetical protein
MGRKKGKDSFRKQNAAHALASAELETAARDYLQAREDYDSLRQHLAAAAGPGNKLHRGICLAGEGLEAALARLVRAARSPAFDDDVASPYGALGNCWPLPDYLEEAFRVLDGEPADAVLRRELRAEARK